MRLLDADIVRPLLRNARCALLAGTTFGCGTAVDTGENLEKGQPQDLDASAVDGEDPAIDPGVLGGGGAGPTYAPDGTPIYPESGGDGGGTGGATLTCFGPAPGLSQDLLTFCDGLEPELKTRFAAPLALICNERRLVNLTLKPCSWSGAGSSDKFRRVLQRTDLDDQTTTDFASLMAYGVTTESDLDAQVALTFREMNDPAYEATFVKIRNSRIYDVAPIGPEAYEYSAELASSAATVSFRSRMEARRISGNLVAVFDYSIGDTVIIKEHRFLRLLFRAEPGTTRIIAVDEKLIGDGGTHTVAYQNVTDVLKQRMERDHENSRRD